MAELFFFAFVLAIAVVLLLYFTDFIFDKLLEKAMQQEKIDAIDLLAQINNHDSDFLTEQINEAAKKAGIVDEKPCRLSHKIVLTDQEIALLSAGHLQRFIARRINRNGS